jgi:uncharacterized protein YlxW (UPF0749 family)
LKQLEESVYAGLSPVNQKQIQADISARKSQLESLGAEEQQQQTAEMEARKQVRTEQSKLNELEERVDRLEKELDNHP